LTINPSAIEITTAIQLLDGGFLSFSMACSTENEPGR